LAQVQNPGKKKPIGSEGAIKRKVAGEEGEKTNIPGLNKVNCERRHKSRSKFTLWAKENNELQKKRQRVK